MAWLKCNGIELARVVSLPSPPSSEHREIGNVSEAASGKTVVTRIARKRDLKLTTRPLSATDAAALEALLMGEGHVFSFDVSKYSSKGLGPAGGGSGTLESTSPAPKYGAQYLRLAPSDVIVYEGVYETGWSLATWLQFPGLIDDWTHYVETSDGRHYKNGVRDESFVLAPTFAFAAGDMAITNGSSFQLDLDDLVVSPFAWPADWPAQIAAAGVAFGPAPFLLMTGDMVREAATRLMVGKSVNEKFTIANPGGSAIQRDVRTLDFELAEV